MNDNDRKIEAVLFAVGKEITTERLASLCLLDPVQVEECIVRLQEEYQHRDNSLHLIRKENAWKLTVKDQFIPLVSSIVQSTELERPLMETLAVVAWRYPIVQADVIKLRSPAAYDHLRQLEEMGFVAKERDGRTYKIKLTQKFFNYFDLPSEEAKQAFLKNVPHEILAEAEDVNKEADEVERLIDLEKKESVARTEIKKALSEVHGPVIDEEGAVFSSEKQ